MERNNRHFTVQRSTDGRTFTELGERESQDEADAVQTYRFTDGRPVTGTNYYRIQQTDLDGQTLFSDVLTAILTASSDAEPTVVLYPNPGKDEVWFSRPAEYQLFDVNGTLLAAGRAEGAVDVSGLPAGMYRVRIDGGVSQPRIKR